MRRILLIDQTGELGGAELCLVDVAGHLAECCHVVLFADGPLRGVLEDRGISVEVLNCDRSVLGVSRQVGGLRAVAAISGVMRGVLGLARIARSFDVLYANSQKAAVIGLLAGLSARKPVVWYLHDMLCAEHFGPAQRRLVVTLANLLARRVLVNSVASRDAYIASGGRSGHVAVLHNGLDPTPFAAVSDASTLALRRNLGVDGFKVVGLFGRISRWKGQHVLLDALAYLPEVHALLVGDALFGENDYKAEIAERSQALGDRVHYLGFRKDVPELMRASDLVVHTSTSPEPFGRVIVEAMFARRPVLATADGGPRELLGEGHPHLVPPGSPTALAAAIRDALSMPHAAMQALVEANYTRAVRLFGLNGMMRDLDRELALVA